MEKFQFYQSFATLRRPQLLYYMTSVFQLYIVIAMILTDFPTAKNSYFRTITIILQDMEKFHFYQSFVTLGRPQLLYYMTSVFQL